MADFDASEFAGEEDSVEGLPQVKEKKKKKKKKAAAVTAETSLTGGGEGTYGNDLFDGDGEGGDEDDGPAGRALVLSDYEKGASVFSDEDMKKCVPDARLPPNAPGFPLLPCASQCVSP